MANEAEGIAIDKELTIYRLKCRLCGEYKCLRLIRRNPHVKFSWFDGVDIPDDKIDNELLWKCQKIEQKIKSVEELERILCQK